MNTTDNTRMVYIARHKFIPGAYAICSAANDFAEEAAKIISGWLREGATIERVTREQAIAEFQTYVEARKTPPQDQQHLPMMLRRQAD